MKHIEEAQTDGADVLRCTNCKDQLALKADGWPFWLHLAIREAFAETHKACERQEAGKYTIYESISYDRQEPFR